ncbi:MAG TPA: permease [Sedimenticola thiotaurini]|uniref:Permease n=1 Tax=Sedimenticola thiotaurini TaxID=1543721 RepID=A0A831RN21_9GAMM|nr:permease [Sedimenticola thiotaurini]
MNNTSVETIDHPTGSRLTLWLVGIGIAVPLWFLAYFHLPDLADFLLSLTGYDRSSHMGEALHFFFYDTPKVLMLLAGIVFFMGIIQTFFAPERTRALLAGKRLGIGNTLAATLGIVTPFCSCSAVPLFIGFLSAGVPLGVTFSFLVSAPMVNEIALALLLGLFGWQIAALYLGLGLLVAIVSGLIIGKLGMERHLQDWVREIHAGTATPTGNSGMNWEARFQAGWHHVKEIVWKVWPYILVGIAVGAGIHGFVPQDFMASFMGKDVWWSVPAAVVMGVPMYTNAAGIIPIVEALIGKGAALGTTLAFMMSVIALSLPEILILRKVLKLPLIATFVGVVSSGILLVGFLFNILL